MTEKTINCAECNVEFTFEENPKYPRKYCLNCSAKKKKEFKVMSKTEAKVTPDAEMGAPVEKVDRYIEVTKPKNGKEYHLSPEQVRSNSLNMAIEFFKVANISMNIEQVWDIAKQFEEWINGN